MKVWVCPNCKTVVGDNEDGDLVLHDYGPDPIRLECPACHSIYEICLKPVRVLKPKG